MERKILDGIWLAFVAFVAIVVLVNYAQPMAAEAAASSTKALDQIVLSLLAFALTVKGMVTIVLIVGGIFAYSKIRGYLGI